MHGTEKILFALTILLLAACSRVADLAYNNAPRFVASELDDAFDLNPAQVAELDNRLEKFFAWHREQELTRYREVLDRAALAAADGITASEFLALHDELGAAWDRALLRIIDSLGELAVGLSPEQIERYQQYHHEGSDEYREYMDKTEQQREIYRVQRAYERLEGWFGDFDYMLGERVQARLRQLPDIYQPWFEYREQRHQALIAALRDVPARGFERERLLGILLDPSTAHARAFAPARNAYWRAYASALEDISSWLDKRQRQRVVTRLQRYVRLLDRLQRS